MPVPLALQKNKQPKLSSKTTRKKNYADDWKPFDITDIRCPRPPTRSKYESADPKVATMATTFGKSIRDVAFATTTSKEGTGGSASAAPTSLRMDTSSKWSSWAAKPHHVVFRGTSDVSGLLGRRVATRIEGYDPNEDELNKTCTKPGVTIFKNVKDPTVSLRGADEGIHSWKKEFKGHFHRDRLESTTQDDASISGASANGRAATPSATTAAATPRVQSPKDAAATTTTTALPPSRSHLLFRHRNLEAITVNDGRPVSTFGGASRDGGESRTLQIRLYPGPGQYYNEKGTSKGDKGLLQGGLKERGQIIMTRNGLVSETPMPRSQSAIPMLRGESPTDGLGLLPSPFADGAADELQDSIGLSRALGSRARSRQELRPSTQMSMVFHDSHTHNAQLRQQERHKKRLLNIPLGQ